MDRSESDATVNSYLENRVYQDCMGLARVGQYPAADSPISILVVGCR